MWILYTLLSLLAIAAILALFAVLPGRRRDRAPFDRTLYAHRGLHSDDSRYPENSLIAFRLAREAGYGVELDVQLTADKQVVVFHDDTLLRMCGVDRRVDELTYEELQQLSLLDSQHRIPLLTDVLEVLDGAPVLCEFKAMRSYTDTSLCEIALPILRGYKGPFCVESFNPLMIRWFRKNAPDVIRGVLSKKFTEEDHLKPILGFALCALLTNCLSRPDFIAFCYKDKKLLSFSLCRALYRPYTVAWTLREEEALAASKEFDAVIFENIDKEALCKAGRFKTDEKEEKQ